MFCSLRKIFILICLCTHLAIVRPAVSVACLLDPEDPVDRLGQVDDLDAGVVGEERVPVREDVEVLAPHERDLKGEE